MSLKYVVIGAGAPPDPTTQGWATSQVIQGTGGGLAAALELVQPHTVDNVGPGATGWAVHDYLDQQTGGADDRPEYTRALTAGAFASMAANGWKYTAVFKLNNVDNFNQQSRVLSIDQEGGDGLPFDIKVNAGYVGDEQGENLELNINASGGAAGAGGDLDTGFDAEEFNTVTFEDVDGDGSFTIDVNGTLLDGGATFFSDPNDNAVPFNNLLVIGANSSGGDGAGIEYDLVRLEFVPEPGSFVLFGLAFASLAVGRRRR